MISPARAREIAESKTREELVTMLETAIARENAHRRNGTIAVVALFVCGLASSVAFGPFIFGWAEILIIAMLCLVAYAHVTQWSIKKSGVDDAMLVFMSAKRLGRLP